MKKYFLILLLAAISFSLFAQNAPGLSVVLDKLKKHSASHPFEKAYLHFDKPYYAAGDTIYFKAYVVAGDLHQPSTISRVLYVDLIDPQNKILKTIRPELINGLGAGDFTLNYNLPGGKYRIRAYTRWMRNEGDDAFFEQTIPVASIQANNQPEYSVKANVGQPDFQLFPEGGELVTDIDNKIAFKATGVNGLSIELKGSVLDENNKEIVQFASQHLGMGQFELKPIPGKKYSAHVRFANGAETVVPLPAAQTEGITMAVNNESLGVVAIQINQNPAYFQKNRGHNYGLLIRGGGKVTGIPLKLDSVSTVLVASKHRMPTGIAQITLLDDQSQPLCERLIFVKNNDALKLAVNSDKPVYQPRGKVTLNLTAKDASDSLSQGSFSVSVTDETKVPVKDEDEHTIFTGLLLTGDLKGYIEQPNYYFQRNDSVINRSLDLVMLTHGYRHFSWKQLKDSTNAPLAWQPEIGFEINGTIKNLLGTRLDAADVNLLHFPGGVVASTKSDTQGKFSFKNLLYTDTNKFIIQGAKKNGSINTQFIYDSTRMAPPPVLTSLLTDTITPAGIKAYLPSASQRHADYLKYDKNGGVILREVTIKDTKTDNNYPSSSITGPGFADKVIHAKDLEKFGGPLTTILQNFVNGRYAAVKMFILDDFTEGPGFNLDDINPINVETLEFFIGPNASIFGPNSGGGVLVITTKKGGGIDPKNVQSKGILPLTLYGFYKAREFYMPKYDVAAINSSRRDLRSTIYWQPQVVTDKSGTASINYFNADGTGSYRVVVEGIDKNGNIGRAVYHYTVQ